MKWFFGFFSATNHQLGSYTPAVYLSGLKPSIGTVFVKEVAVGYRMGSSAVRVRLAYAKLSLYSRPRLYALSISALHTLRTSGPLPRRQTCFPSSCIMSKRKPAAATDSAGCAPLTTFYARATVQKRNSNCVTLYGNCNASGSAQVNIHATSAYVPCGGVEEPKDDCTDTEAPGAQVGGAVGPLHVATATHRPAAKRVRVDDCDLE